MGPKVRKNGFLGKSGSKCVKTHFLPTLNPFWDIDENPFFTHFKGLKGVEIVAEKGPEAALTQHK